MPSPPRGARQPRRRGHLVLLLIVGFAILAFGALTVVFGFDQLKQRGFIKTDARGGLQLKTASSVEEPRDTVSASN